MNRLLARAWFAHNPLLRFTLVAGAIYLLWFFGYERYLAPDGRLDTALIRALVAHSVAVLRGLGFEATVSSAQWNLILLRNQPTVFIAPYCDGMVLYTLFSGFVLAFPTSSRHKLWFVPLGVALIYGVNVLRLVAMSLNHYYSYQTLDFNHHYTFAFLMYWFIGWLWVWWATRLAGPVEGGPLSRAVPPRAYA
ncbi:exosortase X [Hymenobacter arizonensis]|uniref:Exosortase/archaeosortase family protein n=1 Tax=Hymenobacter arizonensis TaxID=1227077 RepID=A0A1I6BQ64_HYMAR|nr:archaeosortase/exosortase family protein [Hymenobacter arizonensis]SFQ83024.1 exosortase/archaeosortase family protein [Hymenobacter arizonensis]